MPGTRLVVGSLALTLVGGCADAQSAPAAREPLPACEWCGAAEAPAALGAEAVLAGPEEPGTRLVVTGTVYRPDGRTPAAGVLLYAYHTNAAGVYPRRGDETGNGRRHGYLRGWLRTDAQGRYRLVTIRPAAYPTRAEPAHIHLTVTPPGGEERWVAHSTLFADDPLLTAEDRRAIDTGPRSHVVRPTRDANGVLHARRDIVLERWPAAAPESLAVDRRASIIRWKGTKGRGLGKHEGTVRLSGGALALCGRDVCGGEFRVDMRSIAVTDIPAHDPVPRERLTRHLMAEDFFWVERHPTAVFRLQSVRSEAAGRYAVTGELLLRGVARRITFPATLVARTGDEARVGARFTIDRQQWGVSSPGRLRDLLVDDDIQLDLTLVVRGAALADAP